jgi:hypothetical protein
MGQQLKSAPIHTAVWTARPPILDRGRELLPPPYRASYRDLIYGENSLCLACDRYSLTAVLEALTINMPPP